MSRASELHLIFTINEKTSVAKDFERAIIDNKFFIFYPYRNH